jgi:hypothetical protein
MAGRGIAGAGCEAGDVSGGFAATAAVGGGAVGVARAAIGIPAAIVPAVVPLDTEVRTG